ncbi:MAG TPA: AIR synthase-related protein, partial [Candidatus Angelobacter sp.]|nr:AIR synthase-related protein [Candidatus Angelobacter sp.]
FSQVVDGLTAACEALETPITGGNVSLYNETLGEGIYPTPVVGVVGILEDISVAMTCHFRKAGRDVLLLRGGPAANAATAEIEIGSSEYAKAVLGQTWGTPPALDLKPEVALQKCLRELIQQRSVESAHDCSDGGLAVALAESAFATGVGAEIELTAKDLFLEFILFGECATRVIISCDPGNTSNIQQLAVKWGLSADRIGRTVPANLSIKVNGGIAIAASVSELKQVWETALAEALHAEAPEMLQTN